MSSPNDCGPMAPPPYINKTLSVYGMNIGSSIYSLFLFSIQWPIVNSIGIQSQIHSSGNNVNIIGMTVFNIYGDASHFIQFPL